MSMDKGLTKRVGRWGALISTVVLAGCVSQLGGMAPANAEEAAAPVDLPAATTVPDNEFNQMIGAGERGCGTCHGDMWGLYETLHNPLEGGFDTVQDVQMCLDCHNDGQAGPAAWGKEFGTVIHGIHKSVETADCWSCHATEYGQNDMQLWDVVKYDLMQGIVKVDAETAVSPEGLQASLEYGQDMTVSQDTLFTINNLAGPRDMEYAGVDPELTGDALAAEEQRVWEEWTFTVHGNVENERTWTLDELIAEFPPEDVNLKMACFHNPVGGNVIGAVNAQGIKLSKVLEAAGADMESDFAILENASGMNPCCTLDRLENTYLVVSIDGEPLLWRHGYPLTIWYPDYTNPAAIKQGLGIELCSGEPYMNLTAGAVNRETGEYVNIPNIAVVEYENGASYELGDTVTINGYADGWNVPIEAVEVSLDNGATWTTFETPDTSLETWVNWSYSFTPQQAGSYVVTLRSVGPDGMTTPRTVQVMANVYGTAEEDPYAGMPPEMVAAAKAQEAEAESAE